ncbi:hypothetical protein B0A54_14430 [Friedmanniomyces endolithicus]|uniref:26S proteasome complex subunit SEM1 n=1 Tax=Friedmanniomyces endolithicus TaxID=329885 RepID=A0A4V5N5K7_9PEZI|nr:hypothetical protein B0A54_14430 [Friedmanniomyces endolithicus]
MSGAAQPNAPTSKLQPSSDSSDSTKQPPATKPAAAQLDEDDEFEDFPVEDWSKEEEVGAQQQQQQGGNNTHLWEESWDDDDTSDDFSVQLKAELKKMEGGKKG